MNHRRFQEIDIAKGIGIILVIIGHSIASNDFIYSFHMPLFFMLSGIVMNDNSSRRSIRDFISEERKLIALYVFYSIVYILFDIIIRVLVLNTHTISYLINDIMATITTYGISVLWFIITLAIAKILTKIFCDFIKCSIMKIIVSCLCFFVIALSIKHLNTAGLHGLKKLIGFVVIAGCRAVAMTGFVMLGYTSKRLIMQLIGAKWFRAASALILVNVLFYKYTGDIDLRQIKFGECWITFILSITGTLSVLSISCIISKIKYISNFIAFLGVNSLFIMVTHEYLMIKSLIKYVYIHLEINTSVMSYIIIEISVLMCIEILLARFLSRYVNRLFNIIYKRIP